MSHTILPVGIVVSRFNQTVTELLLEGATVRLQELGFKPREIVWVPGAVEIPIMTQHLARTGHYEAIICLGAVIKGQTDHYDYVCQQVSYGCQKVALKYHLPIIFGVLTTPNLELALARVGGDSGHAGRDAADTALYMMKTLAGSNKDGKTV